MLVAFFQGAFETSSGGDGGFKMNSVGLNEFLEGHQSFVVWFVQDKQPSAAPFPTEAMTGTRIHQRTHCVP